MADTIRELIVSLGVDGADADKQLDKIDKGIDAVKSAALVGAAVVVGFTAALVGLVTGAANAGDAALKGAQKTGLGVEAYQELAYAASQSNVETSELELALAKQTNSLSALAAGVQPAVDAYKALGLTQKDLAGLSADEAFELTASKIAAMTDEQKKLQAAQDIYGVQLAGKLLPLLNEGGAGIGALREEAQKLGIVIGEDNAQAAADFNDSLDRVKQIVKSVATDIGLKLLPIAEKIVDRIQGWITANRELIDTKIDVWTKRISDGFDIASKAITKVDDIVQKTFGGWGPILGAAAAVVGLVTAALVVLKVSAAWTAISGAISALGVLFGLTFGQVILVAGAVVAAIVVLGLVVQDLWTFFQGGDSVFGRLLTRFPVLRSFVTSAATAFGKVVDVVKGLWPVLETLGAIWYAVFTRTTLPALKLVGAAVMWLGGVVFAGLGFWLDNIVIPALNLVASALDWVGAKAQAFLAFIQPALDLADKFLASVGLGGAEPAGGPEAAPAGGTTAGVGAAAAPPTTAASLFGDTGAFAPSPSELGAGSSTSSSKAVTVNQAGDTINISGLGLSAEEVKKVIADAQAAKASQAASAVEGARV